ncbi:MAG: hypothetical protein ACRENJ_04065 [Candidatus Eiseniibacteriota bacterium]
MAQIAWILGVVAMIAATVFVLRRIGRAAATRAAVFEEVRRTLRDGRMDRAGGVTVVRGQLGQLEVSVDLQRDSKRPRQSPMWRVSAEGPVALERPIEARVGAWEGWIDPWLQLGETLTVLNGAGPGFTLHAERPPRADHPLVAALRRQGERLGPGAFHARHDLLRAETRFGARLEENRPLFAYLHVVGEIAELPQVRVPRPAGPQVPRYGALPEA